MFKNINDSNLYSCVSWPGTCGENPSWSSSLQRSPPGSSHGWAGRADQLPPILTRQAWEIAATTLCIIYSCFLHNFHVQDDEKHFSTSKAHSYWFNSGIRGFTKCASSVLHWQQGVQGWWRTGDLPSGARGLLCSKQIKPQRARSWETAVSVTEQKWRGTSLMVQ